MTTVTPADRAVDQVVAVLRRSPAGLFTDIDGTISQVARIPSEAFIEDSPRESLRALGRAISIVGVITGRGAADASTMLGLEGTVVIGNHDVRAAHFLELRGGETRAGSVARRHRSASSRTRKGPATPEASTT